MLQNLRKIGGRIIIGDDVEITLLQIGVNHIRLRVIAPCGVAVVRRERSGRQSKPHSSGRIETITQIDGSPSHNAGKAQHAKDRNLDTTLRCANELEYDRPMGIGPEEVQAVRIHETSAGNNLGRHDTDR